MITSKICLHNKENINLLGILFSFLNCNTFVHIYYDTNIDILKGVEKITSFSKITGRGKRHLSDKLNLL